MQNQILKNWQKVRLSEVTSLIKDGTHGTHKDVAEGIPLLSAKDVSNGKIDLSNDPRRISLADYKSIHRNYEIQKGDILLTVVGTIGRVAIVKDFLNKFTVQRSVAILRMKNTILPEYCYQFIQSDQFQKDLTQGAHGLAQAGVYLGELGKKVIPVPPINIQQKISNYLNAIDDAIENANQLIQKIEVLKQGLMNDMLTRGIGHSKFKKTKLGEVPEKWNLVQIKQTSQVKGGKRLPKGTPFASEVTSHPYLRIVDFKNMTIDSSNLRYIDENTFKQISRYIINKEDIYISIAGTIGIVGSIPEELNGANLTENAAKIVIQNGFIKEYLAYFLSSPLGQFQVRNLTVKTTQPKLALNKIEEIIVPLPTKEEQREIVDILNEVDKKYGNEVDGKNKLLSIKNGLMQDIFSQKVQIN